MYQQLEVISFKITIHHLNIIVMRATINIIKKSNMKVTLQVKKDRYIWHLWTSEFTWSSTFYIHSNTLMCNILQCQNITVYKFTMDNFKLLKVEKSIHKYYTTTL